MKKFCLLFFWALLPFSALGQGYVHFANFDGPRLDSRFFDVDGTTRLNGPNWYVELLAGADQNSLGPALPLFSGWFTDGYFNAGSRTISNITGVDGFAVVQVWDKSASSFAEAVSLGLPHGETSAFPFAATPLGSTLPPAVLVNMPSLTLVPEPSGFLLLVFGAGIVHLFRRTHPPRR